jgi:hypothetical protein
MNDFDQEKFENELRGLKPAPPPGEFVARLIESRPLPQPELRREPRRPLTFNRWLPLFRWLVPAAALVMVAGAVWRWTPKTTASGDTATAASAGLKADDVQVGRELVSAFDAVTKLPTGEPVRFRCRQWMDEVVLRDKESGMVIQQRTPRVEVVAVRYDTY